MADSIKKVAIVGVTGRIGGAFAKETVKTGKHEVTGITRAGTNASAIPSGVKTVQVDYDKEETLVEALKGQDFLAITLSVRAPPGTHSKIVQAAVKAGVRYIMPNAYGYDASMTGLRKDIPGGEDGWKNCEEITKLGGTSIIMACGFWYQWSLAIGEQWYGFDIKNRKVVFYDEGKTVISTSTWDQCGRAFAALVSLPVSGASPSVDDWKNATFPLESFRLCQRDMLDSLHRVLGTSDADWKISYEPTDQRYKDGMQEMQSGNMLGFAKAMYARAFYPTGEALLDENKLVNKPLNLPKEDLDTCTKETVQMVESGWNPWG